MKKNILFTILALLVTFCCCSNKKQVLDKPEDLINRNTMVKIIAECYLIESTVNTDTGTVPKDKLTQLYYNELFHRYKITREQFMHSLDYYVSEESSAEKLLTDASTIITKKYNDHGGVVEENELNNSTFFNPISDSTTAPGVDTIPQN